MSDGEAKNTLTIRCYAAPIVCSRSQPLPEPGLARFLSDPKIPLDTNSVGRALRGVAMGRKNHYGSRSERGTRTAALFYSLIESAKRCRVEPRAYLWETALRARPERGHGHPGARPQAQEILRESPP